MRLERLARNEDLFREVNEAIEHVARSFRDDAHLFQFLCECADTGCGELVDLTVGEYEHVRSRPEWFVVLDGHQNPELEQVRERHAGYLVVEKTGEAGDTARRLDPRAA
jgi:hypothetical protein